MSSDLEPTKIDYVIRKVTQQVYNVFPFVDIKCEPNLSWNNNEYDIIVRWYYKGEAYAFKYTITNDALDYFADSDYIVHPLVPRICNEIMKPCNEDEEEDN